MLAIDWLADYHAIIPSWYSTPSNGGEVNLFYRPRPTDALGSAWKSLNHFGGLALWVRNVAGEYRTSLYVFNTPLFHDLFSLET
jgi:hypothetical protein